MAQLRDTFQHLLAVTSDDLRYFEVEEWVNQEQFKPFLIGLVAFEKFIDSDHIAAFWRQLHTLTELNNSRLTLPSVLPAQVIQIRAQVLASLPPIKFLDHRDESGPTGRVTARTPFIRLHSLIWRKCEVGMKQDKIVTLAFCIFVTLIRKLSTCSDSPLPDRPLFMY